MAISTSADFVTKFHNLDGDLISERKKSFFILLRTASKNLTPQEIDTAIENLNPTFYQEKLFYIETLVYFKKVAPLIETLKKCNREHIKILVRQKWFIQEAFKDITPAELVNDFFPCVSYSTRLKLLGRIPNYWSEEKNDELFDCVCKRYGLFIALRVLHTCHVPILLEVLQEYEIVLNTYQVISLLNQNEDLIRTYFNHYHNIRKAPFAENNVLNILAVKHPKLFLELETSNKICPQRINKAATILLIGNSKKEIVDNSHHYIKFLNMRALVKYLGSDFDVFYKKLVPEKMEDLNSKCSFFQLLKHFPKNRRWDLFVKGFRATFPHKTINEFFKSIDSTIIKLNPNRETIFNWAEIKYKTTGDDHFLQYYSPSVSIPILKEKINVTSDLARRQALLKLLISTCAQNKDIQSLDEVLEYIGSRHKNEDSQAYKKLMDFVLEQFDEEELSKNHWIFLSQQMALIRTVGVVEFYDCRYTLQTILEYFCKVDKEIFKVIIVDFVKEAATSWCHFRTYSKDYELEREIFTECCQLLPTIIPPDHKNLLQIKKTVISDFVQLCEKKPERCLNLLEFPWFVSAIEAACNKKDLTANDDHLIKSGILYNIFFSQYALPFLNESKILELLTMLCTKESGVLRDIFLCIVRKPDMSELERRIMTFSLENLDIDPWHLDVIVDWCLKYHPKLLLSSFDRTWPKLSNYYDKIIKHYAHISLDKMICGFIQNTWSEMDGKEQETAVDILLNLLPEEKFIEFVNRNLDLDLENQEDTKLRKVLLRICESLKNVADPCLFLPVVLKFCQGIYLQNALPSLYSLFSRSPENIVNIHLKILSEQSAPVQKHAIQLACLLLYTKNIINVLSESRNGSTYSVLKAVCVSTVKYLSKNIFTDNFMPILHKHVSIIDKYDKQLFSTLVKANVLQKYRPQYVEMCWKKFENVREQQTVNAYLDKLLQLSLNGNTIKLLSSGFVNKVLRCHFSVEGKDRFTNIDHFAALCLFHRQSERADNFKIVFEIVSKLNKTCASLFCKKFIDLQEDLDIAVVTDFIDHWKRNLSLVDTLEEYISLNLVLKQTNFSKETCAKNVVDYLEQLIVELGPSVFEIFKTNFEAQINKQRELNKYQLLYLILKYKASPTNCVFVLDLIEPGSSKDNEDIKSVYENIIDIIKLTEEPIVKCHYEMYLDKHDMHQ